MSGLRPAADVAETALAGAGGRGRIAIVREVVEAEVRFANNTVTTNGVRRDRHVSIISFADRPGGIAAGVASGSGALELSDLVSAAEAEAAAGSAAEDAFDLVGPGNATGAPTGEPDADGGGAFGDEPGSTNLETLSGVIGRLSDLFGAAEGAGQVMAGFAQHRVTTTYVASTTGLRKRHVQPDGSIELVGRSADGSRSAWAGAGTNWFDDIDLGALQAKVTRGLGWAERRIELPPGRYETILPGDAVADVMLMIDAGASGREAEEGRTVFSAPGGRTRVGERLSGTPFEYRSDPSETGLECAPFVVTGASSADESVFDNGAPMGRVALISDGELRRLRYHRAGAARSGTAFTPQGGNVVLEVAGATAELDDLVRSTKRGLLLTCLWYIREVDPATMLYTGLTRDGVYLVEDGEVTGVVTNFRFNESPVDLLARTAEAGRTERCLSREWGYWFTRTAMPPIRVPDFNMSSVSPAT